MSDKTKLLPSKRRTTQRKPRAKHISCAVKEYTLDKVLSDDTINEREGTYFEEKDIPIIIDHDADIYVNDPAAIETGGRRLLAKLRKGVFSDELINIGWEGFFKTAAASRNRGAAAGPIDMSSMYWKKRQPVKIDKWSTQYIQDGKVSKMRVNNNVYSSVLGYFEETPFMGLPCRLTSYTQAFFKYYKKGLPFIRAIDEQFRHLIPDKYSKQLRRITKDPFYRIKGTAFSSITVNRNFRTALHKDAGDFKDGFGNLTVIERGKYHGGYTLFPQYGIGIDLRTSDFLAMDVHEWHCNTAMYETKEDAEFNKAMPQIYRHSADTGTQGVDYPYTRLSFVCYLREKIEGCDVDKTKSYYKKIKFDPEFGRRAKTQKRKSGI